MKRNYISGMTDAETALFDAFEPTAEQVRAACLSVHGLPREERYVRLMTIGQRVRWHAPQYAAAVGAFQSFGPDAVVWRRVFG